jgi:XTP/dITP diphosphohydrolase
MTIIIASDNAGKVKELKTILEAANIEVALQSQFKVKPVPEIGLTFVENAIIKARNCCEQMGMSIRIKRCSRRETDSTFSMCDGFFA